MIPHDSDVQDKFEQAILTLNRSLIRKILGELSTSHAPLDIIEMLIAPTLDRIGHKWEAGSVALSQVYMGGKMCKEIVQTLFPADTVNRSNDQGIAIAVLHDYHVLGKRIVVSVLRTLGYPILDYGHGIDVDMLVKRVKDDNIRILLISTLMLPAALLVQDVRNQLQADGYTTKIIVGGAPFRFDDQLWKVVGADAMGRSASDAIEIVARLSASA